MKCTVVVCVSSSVLNGCYSIKRHTCISHNLNIRNGQSMVLYMKNDIFQKTSNGYHW